MRSHQHPRGVTFVCVSSVFVGNSKLFLMTARASCPYVILGVSRHASRAQIRRRYIELSLKLHPDRQHYLQPRAHERASHKGISFSQVSAAYYILGSQERRQRYDESTRPLHSHSSTVQSNSTGFSQPVSASHTENEHYGFYTPSQDDTPKQPRYMANEAMVVVISMVASVVILGQLFWLQGLSAERRRLVEDRHREAFHTYRQLRQTAQRLESREHQWTAFLDRQRNDPMFVAKHSLP